MTKRIDPLLCDIDLPLSATFYPAGFPLRLSTNSPAVLASAAEAWDPFRPLFTTPPLDFRIVVEPAGPAAAEPRFRKQAEHLHFVSDAHNFAAGDCRTLSATFNLSEATAADHVRLRWFYLEAFAYMLLTQRYVVSLHAGCVAREGRGILICGRSGSGKSTLSFACARAGFTFLSDDCTWLPLDARDSAAIGKPHMLRFRADAGRHFPELQGYQPARHPNGKCSVELPTRLFPSLQTASRAPIQSLVFLDRESSGPARLERMTSGEAMPLLLEDLPSYGPQVNAAHEETIQRLASLPCWHVRYRTLEDAIRLLSQL